jgi:hypothetical protein
MLPRAITVRKVKPESRVLPGRAVWRATKAAYRRRGTSEHPVHRVKALASPAAVVVVAAEPINAVRWVPARQAGGAVQAAAVVHPEMGVGRVAPVLA